MRTTPSSTVNTTLGNVSAKTKTSAMLRGSVALALKLDENALQLVGDVAQRGFGALPLRGAVARLVRDVEHARRQRRPVGHEGRADRLAGAGLRKNVRVTDRNAARNVDQRVVERLDLRVVPALRRVERGRASQHGEHDAVHRIFG